ncbi:MAG: expansin-like protein [Fibrobacteraceae bacterium]|nr:expansin-like protein [Fibrobacteraceae bacterium]
MTNKLFHIAFPLLISSLIFSSCGEDSKSQNSVQEDISSSSKETVSSSSIAWSSSITSSSSIASSSSTDTSGVCTSCDSYTARDPVITENGGSGSITTYGSISAKEASQGGACNYGETGIHYYSAIHVNISAGDGLGPWQGGKACGGCVHVRAKTESGWKETTVRITDKCPDEYCGVDLGGAPAYDLMGIQVGRYEGEWEFVSCEGIENVYDDSTSIFVKDGANAYWSLIQVRNPPDAVTSISILSMNDSTLYELEWATEAENFFTVPKAILADTSNYELTATFKNGGTFTWKIKGTALSEPENNIYLK